MSDNEGFYGDYGDADQGGDFGYDQAGYEGDAGGLEDHWSHHEDWSEFADQLVTWLRNDPDVMQGFQGWLGERLGEKPVSGIRDQRVQTAALEHVREFNRTREKRDWER